MGLPVGRNNFRCIRKVLLLLLLILPFSGCIIVPIPVGVGKVLDGEEVSAEQFQFLVDPATRKDDVLRLLGPPNLIWEDANVFAYNWRISNGKLLWAVFGNTTGIGGMAQLSSGYVLLIQFDESGKIIRIDRLSHPAINKYGRMLRDWVSQPLPGKPTLPGHLLKIDTD